MANGSYETGNLKGKDISFLSMLVEFILRNKYLKVFLFISPVLFFFFETFYKTNLSVSFAKPQSLVIVDSSVLNKNLLMPDSFKIPGFYLHKIRLKNTGFKSFSNEDFDDSIRIELPNILFYQNISVTTSDSSDIKFYATDSILVIEPVSFNTEFYIDVAFTSSVNELANIRKIRVKDVNVLNSKKLIKFSKRIALSVASFCLVAYCCFVYLVIMSIWEPFTSLLNGNGEFEKNLKFNLIISFALIVVMVFPIISTLIEYTYSLIKD